ncbi:MAG: hypothetical protein V1770_04105 [bacterium]
MKITIERKKYILKIMEEKLNAILPEINIRVTSLVEWELSDGEVFDFFKNELHIWGTGDFKVFGKSFNYTMVEKIIAETMAEEGLDVYCTDDFFVVIISRSHREYHLITYDQFQMIFFVYLYEEKGKLSSPYHSYDIDLTKLVPLGKIYD